MGEDTKMTDLEAIPKEGRHLIFCDYVKDDLIIEDAILQTCQFRRIGARNAVFRKCSLTQCLFEDTYFRKASFNDVRFTGSTFRKCNLEKATFQGCDLRFCKFESTFLNRDEIVGNLPVEPILRRNLARNLRKNFEALGDKESSDVFLNIEIEAHEQELLGGFRRKTAYYQQHYTQVDQVIAGLKYITSKLSGIVWGYGHRLSRLLASYLVVSCFFAFITYFFDLSFIVDTEASPRTLGFWESTYHVFSVTLGTGTISIAPFSLAAKMFEVIEGFLGTLFLALLAAAAYRRISR